MRHFKFLRMVDLTGTSGVGFVAAGHVESDGRTFVRWTVEARLADGTKRKINSVTQFETWVDAVLLHGHGGKTVLIWDDTGETVSDLDLLENLKAAA